MLRDARDELEWRHFEDLVVLLWSICNCLNQVRFKGVELLGDCLFGLLGILKLSDGQTRGI